MESLTTPGYTTQILARRWLSDRAYELELRRPQNFTFRPGQYVRFPHEGEDRAYSMLSPPSEPTLRFLIRYVKQGNFSHYLAKAEPGTALHLSRPQGYFLFTPSDRQAVFIATGTGVAPFVAMARAGVRNCILLHGVQTDSELYYETLLRSGSSQYLPCLSQHSEGSPLPLHGFRGRVSEYMQRHFPSGQYDFYLCGSQEMIRHVLLIIDDRFPDSIVRTEIFY